MSSVTCHLPSGYLSSGNCHLLSVRCDWLPKSGHVVQNWKRREEELQFYRCTNPRLTFYLPRKEVLLYQGSKAGIVVEVLKQRDLPDIIKNDF